MTDEQEQFSKQPAGTPSTLSVPNVRTTVSFLAASIVILYPFGVLVFERQLEFAYALDARTAWHAVTVVSQIEVVLHGLQILAAPQTLQFAFIFIVTVATTGLLGGTINDYISMKWQWWRPKKLMRRPEYQVWDQFSESQLKEFVHSGKQKMERLKSQLVETNAQEEIASDCIMSLRHNLQSLAEESIDPIDTAIRRVKSASLMKQLVDGHHALGVARESAMTLKDSIVHQQKTNLVPRLRLEQEAPDGAARSTKNCRCRYDKRLILCISRFFLPKQRIL